jgi:hypothetical protein
MGCLLVGDANVILFYSILFDPLIPVTHVPFRCCGAIRASGMKHGMKPASSQRLAAKPAGKCAG